MNRNQGTSTILLTGFDEEQDLSVGKDLIKPKNLSPQKVEFKVKSLLFKSLKKDLEMNEKRIVSL